MRVLYLYFTQTHLHTQLINAKEKKCYREKKKEFYNISNVYSIEVQTLARCLTNIQTILSDSEERACIHCCIKITKLHEECCSNDKSRRPLFNFIDRAKKLH